MDPTNEDLFRPMTPEERAFCDHMAETFTDDVLQEYIRNEGPFYPIEQVIAEGEEVIRQRWGKPANG